VSARSVRLTGTDRDKAYDDIRQEIISSAIALKCNYVLGYRESISVVNSTDDNVNNAVILFSATGTAVKIRFPKEAQNNFEQLDMQRLTRTNTFQKQGSFKKNEKRKVLQN
jgi:hypothetical protein